MDGPPPPKPRFYDLCQTHQIDEKALIILATEAGVSQVAMNAMRIGDPVRRHEAEKILEAFSKCVGTTYTLDNTDIPTSFTERMY
jgi:hypothetical protein